MVCAPTPTRRSNGPHAAAARPEEATVRIGLTSAVAKPPPKPFQLDVSAELVRLLYRQAFSAILGGSLPGGFLLTYALWDIADRNLLLWWLFGHTSVLLLRLALVGRYFRRAPPPQSAARWASGLAALSLVSGIFWASTCVLFFDPAQPLSVITITVILFALSAGTATIQGFSLLSFLLTAGPMMGTLIVVLLWHGDPVSNTVALLAVFASIAYFVAAGNGKRLHTSSLRLTYENIALRREAEEKTGLLEAAWRSAEQANAAKTRFLAAASHDLRQPIHALGLLFATLAGRVRSAQTEPMLEQIDDSIRAVDSMLTSLLDISRLDAGVVQPNTGPVDLNELLRRLSNEEQPIAELTSNRLRVRATNVFVRTDATMLHRILANLVANALRYTNNGRVLVGARRRGDAIRIDVIDTGPGIPAESLEEIFQEFHQLGNPERDRRRGLGLGLAIVKRLVGLLDHRIEVRSVVGRGSRFSITLPRTEPQRPKRRAVAAAAVHPDVRGRRVLVLDDEVSVVEAMRGLLESWGCAVVAVATPEEAEAHLGSGAAPPDLLIVDYRLRRHASGIEAIGRLRERAGAPIPALVVTGDTAPDRLREAQASGYPLLHKPVIPEELQATMRSLLVR
jgi:signal transduction histidine kinase